MTTSPQPLDAIASPAPSIDADAVAQLVSEQYGLAGKLTRLLGERDQNFRLTLDDGRRYVVKIANAAEDPVITDFQIQALRHLESKKCPIAVPRMMQTRDGNFATTISNGAETHVARIVSYLPGRPLDDVVIDVELARNLGTSLAQLGLALRDFEHEGQNQILLWDLQRAADLRPLLPQVSDQQIHDRIERCLDDVEQNALPVFSSLRHQVIHADLNPGNVLVSEDDASSVAGVIDFGDMVYAPLVADVAIGAAYMRVQDGDPLALISAFITGYCAVTKLDDAEIELLYDLIRTRVITMITLRYWRIAARDADDAYSQSLLQGEGNAERFLQAIDAVPREHFNAQLRQACRS